MSLSPETRTFYIEKIKGFLAEGRTQQEIRDGLVARLKTDVEPAPEDVADELLAEAYYAETVRRLRENPSEKNVRATKTWLMLQGKLPQDAKALIEKALTEIHTASNDPLPVVPDIFKTYPNWVTYESVTKKAPIVSGTFQKAESDNPATWVDYTTARANVKAGKGYQHLGFVTDGERTGYLTGVDLDGCRNASDGAISPWALKLLASLGSTYTEVSPSGGGLRAWVTAHLPANAKDVFKLALSAGFGDKVQIEIYNDARYFCVTGDRYADAPSVVRELSAKEVTELYALIDSLQQEYPLPAAQPKEKKSKRTRAVAQPDGSLKFEPVPPDPAFKALFDKVGWGPLEQRLNKMSDARFHGLKVSGNTMYCPMPGHQPRSTDLTYTPCFGAFDVDGVKNAVCHCFGCEWSGDMVKTVREFDGGEDGGLIKYDTMYDCARAICKEQGLNPDEYFPEKQIGLNQQAAHAATAAPAEWPAITPLDDLLSPVLPFDLNFLPTGLQSWAKDVSERMGVPPDFSGVCALVTVAGVIGRRVFVYPKEFDKEWKESIALSGAVVAPSGAIKTPTWKTFMNVVVELEMDWKKEHSKKMAQYSKDVVNWKKAQKTKEKAINTPEVLEPGQPPARRRIILNDATPEALHSAMEQSPEGVLYYNDELASWVKDLDKEGREAARGIFLAAMNGNDPYAMERIGRGEIFAIMCASIFGGFQPEMLIDFLSESHNVGSGLVPRFSLMVWPDKPKLVAVDRPPDMGAKAQFRNIVRTLALLQAETIHMHFDPAAQVIFNKWLAEHNQKTNNEEDQGKQSHLAKYRGNLPKIAALFQLVDMVALGGSFQGHYRIAADHLQKAIRFLGYLESHMHRIYGSRREGLHQTESLLAARIQKGSIRDGMSTREIQLKCWHGLNNADQIEGALMSLAEHGYVRQMPPSDRPGRPTVRWEINPAIRSLK